MRTFNSILLYVYIYYIDIDFLVRMDGWMDGSIYACMHVIILCFTGNTRITGIVCIGYRVVALMVMALHELHFFLLLQHKSFICKYKCGFVFFFGSFWFRKKLSKYANMNIYLHLGNVADRFL